MTSSPSRPRASGCLAAPLIALLGFACGIVAHHVVTLREIDALTGRPLDPLPFEAAQWAEPGGVAHAEDERVGNELVWRHTPRRRMVDDLIASHLPRGTRRDEVRALLGPCFRWPIFDAEQGFGAEDESFWLGTDPSSLDEDWLVLDFDAGDRLLRATIRPAGDVAPRRW